MNYPALFLILASIGYMCNIIVEHMHVYMGMPYKQVAIIVVPCLVALAFLCFLIITY